MKKLFVVLMSLQLILFPVAHVPVAHAVGTEDYTKDVEGPKTDTARQGDQHYETGMGSEGGYDFYIQQIIVLALGIIGSSVFTSCPQGLKVPSIIAYEAGAVIYIASELFGAEAQNNKHKKDLDHVNMDESKMPKEGGEYQKTMLETSLKEEKDLLAYVKEKRDWMIAITTIWSAATITAAGEEIYAHVSGVGTGTASCTASASKCTLGYAACLAKCEGTMSLGAIGAETAFMDDQPQAKVATYCAPAADDIGACQAYAQTYLGLAFAGCSQLSLFSSEIANKALTMAIMIAWGLLLNSGGSGGDISTYGMLLFSVITLLTSTVSKFIVSTLNYPIPRGAIFAVHAVLGGVVIAGLEDRIEAAENNIKKLEKVIAEFKILSQGGDEIVEKPDGSGNSDSKNPNMNGGDKPVNKLADGPAAKKSSSCLGANNKFGPDECKNPRKVTPAKWELGGGMDTIKDINSKAVDLANATSAGDLEKANALVGDIASKAGKVKELQGKMWKKLNEDRKARGLEPVDFDKSVKAEMAKIQKSFNDAAKEKGFGPAAYAQRANIDLDKLADKKTESPKGNLGAAKGNAKAAAKNPLEGLGLENTGSATNTASEFAIPGEISQTGSGIDQYDTVESDIHKQKEVSIFSLISNRYVLNYERVMKRKDKDKDKDKEAPPGEKPQKDANK